ncbi:hypothetical protein [Kutzneria sp. NPDC051319]|uniref:hypothetical protein n=1 Tax=Kutzneria sp. NPDC051319 TaxID=3155047 RepID=UPI00343B4617
MSGPEHYRAAEELLAEAVDTYGGAQRRQYLAAVAAGHATLALAAATALNALTQHTGLGMVTRSQAESWQPIVSTEPRTAGEQS